MTKDTNVFRESVLPVTQRDTQTLQIGDVSAGNYAVAVAVDRDVNDNSRLDWKFIRIPKAP